MAASTKQTPPVGAELPRVWVLMPHNEHGSYYRAVLAPGAMQELVAALTPAQLASLGLRRVAEEAGKVDETILTLLARCEGALELAGNSPGPDPTWPKLRNDLREVLGWDPVTSAQGGEAHGGGERIRCGCDEMAPCARHQEQGLWPFPPPTASPEREAVRTVTVRTHTGRGYVPATIPAAPTPEAPGAGDAYDESARIVEKIRGALEGMHPNHLRLVGILLAQTEEKAGIRVTGTARPDASTPEPDPMRWLDGAIEVLRASWRRDGTEGESVHKVCDAVDALRAKVAELEVAAKDAQEQRLRDIEKIRHTEAQLAEATRERDEARGKLEEWQMAWGLAHSGSNPRFGPRTPLEVVVFEREREEFHREMVRDISAKLDAARALLREAETYVATNPRTGAPALRGRINAFLADSPTTGKDGR